MSADVGCTRGRVRFEAEFAEFGRMAKPTRRHGDDVE